MDQIALLILLIFSSIVLIKVNGQCPNNYCLNGGTCINCNASFNYCPTSYTYFCVCKPDYCGTDCANRREAVFLLTLQSTNTFIAAYNDPTSVEYNLLATGFNYLATQMLQLNIAYVRASGGVNAQVLSFVSGSIFAKMAISYKIFSGSLNTTMLTTNQLIISIGYACNSVCSYIGLNQTYVTIEFNPNVCNYSQTNSCSQKAACTFLGGVNYTCTCLPGYRDDSNNTGQICTYLPTTAAPGQCGNLICRNGGSCQTSNCPNNATNCCKCLADYVGDQCDSKRQITMIQTLKCSQTFTNDLLNSSSTSFINLANSFIAICRKTMEYFYNSKSISNVVFNCRILQFSSGSVLVNMSVDVAMTTTSVPPPLPTTADLGLALNNSCSSSSNCDSIGLDRINISTISNPNVCLISAINSCSQFATCTFYGGVNYTCTCNSGFVDESNTQPNGRICTESCSNNKCSPGDCRNKTGGEYECINCPTGYNGRFCKNDSQKVDKSQILILICVFIYSLTIFHVTV